VAQVEEPLLVTGGDGLEIRQAELGGAVRVVSGEDRAKWLAMRGDGQPLGCVASGQIKAAGEAAPPGQRRQA